MFVRSYGAEVQPRSDDDDDDANENTRFGISAHYDVFSSLTAVVALDDVAREGRSGLYTVAAPSNHASLRRYFPLEAGDGVLHSWDVLHGVDIEPSSHRTSLIVWFTDYGGGDDDNGSAPPPWLSNPSENDEVGNFVLASAAESVGWEEPDEGEVDGFDHSSDFDPDDDDDDDDRPHPHELYLRSAASGSAFGLCRLGSLVEDGSLWRSNNDRRDTASSWLPRLKDILARLGDDAARDGRRPSAPLVNDPDRRRATAKALWYEAAVRGNPTAQTSLADALMEDYCAPRDEEEERDDAEEERRREDDVLTASVLFAMAAQQGEQDASDALLRVLDLYRSWFVSSGGESEDEAKEEFLRTPVVRTLLAGAA